MHTFTRYLLFQIPGWVIAALVLMGLREWTGLSFWGAIAIFVLWVIIDFALYPFLRNSYERNVETGSERLIGERGVAKEWLRPEGYVQVHGHLWRAVAEPKDQPISPESPVRVVSADGLTLTVKQDQHQ
jgi:membrane protein implicated in regulation of membrane protease activity